MKAVFITGTDTDIGKTYVSALIFAEFSRTLRTAYMKPVQTGCSMLPGGRLFVPDFDTVCPSVEPDDNMVPYRFEPACSPHLAASLAGERIDFDRILDSFELLCRSYEMVIVEGAGGLLAPLTDENSVAELVAKMSIPVVVVTTPRLGTLNHTMLTLESLRLRGIPLAGLVCNNATGLERDYIYTENLRYLSEHVGTAPVLDLDFNRIDEPTNKDFYSDLYARL